ncbi:hypothetical protein MKX01_034781, partial [Papaver californicum]
RRDNLLRLESKKVKSGLEGFCERVYIVFVKECTFPIKRLVICHCINNGKGLKRERHEGKNKKEKDNNSQETKKQKVVAE